VQPPVAVAGERARLQPQVERAAPLRPGHDHAVQQVIDALQRDIRGAWHVVPASLVETVVSSVAGVIGVIGVAAGIVAIAVRGMWGVVDVIAATTARPGPRA